MGTEASFLQGKPLTLSRVVTFVAALLVVKVTLSIVLEYRNYFPPNFRADFLLGRESYFFGAYQWAFYAHIAAGPLTLALGLLLVSERFRRWRPAVHRSLGKLQIALVALVVAPSGAWMAWYAQSGGVAGLGFFLLAVATAGCAVMGWRSALQRRFVEHRCWMWRCFLLLCSAVVVRLVGGLATVTGVDADWVYPLTAWVSWLGPLAAFEIAEAVVWRSSKLPAARASHSLLSRFQPPAPPVGSTTRDGACRNGNPPPGGARGYM